MAPNPQCAALAAAKETKGARACRSPTCPPLATLPAVADTFADSEDVMLMPPFTGLSYGQIASQLGTSEQHVIDGMSSIRPSMYLLPVS